MTLRLAWHRVGCVLASFMILCPATAQEVGSLEWFVEARKKAAAWDGRIPANTYLHLQSAVGPKGDHTTLRELERQVADKPEHPMRSDLRSLRRTLQNGPDLTSTKIWHFDDKNWRVSTDINWEPRAPWTDVAIQQGNAWRLNSTTLTLGYVDEEMFIGGFTPAGGVFSSFKLLATSGIGGATDRKNVKVNVEGENWEAAVGDDLDEHVSIYRGRLKSGTLFIYSMEIVRHKDPTWIGFSYEFEPDLQGGIPEAIPGLRPAIISVVSSPTGKVAPVRTELLEYRRIDSSEDRSRLLAAPSPETGDTLRDMSGVTGIVDRRSGKATAVIDGRRDESASIELPASRRPERSGMPQVVLVASIVLVTIILVVARSKQRKAQYASHR